MGGDALVDASKVYHPLQVLNNPKVPKLGDVTMFDPDYIEGLRAMIAKMPKETMLGHYDNFQEDVLIVIKPEHVNEVLDSTVEHALHGLKPASEAFFGKKVLFVLSGEEWQGLRQLIRPAFAVQSLAPMVSDTVAKGVAMAKIMKPYAEQGKEIDVLLAMSMYHLSAVSVAAFHFDLECIENFEKGPNEVNKSFELMLTELPRRAFSTDPATQNDFEADNEDNRKWKKAATTVRDVITTMVEARLKAKKDKQQIPDDLLEGMIKSYHDHYGADGISAKELVAELGDNLVEMLFAGYNTVVNVISNALYFVSMNPEYFAKLQKEIDAVCGDSLPTHAHMEKLVLCRQMFHESLRLVPPAAVLGRMLTSDIQLDGVTIPKGVEICLPAFAIHTNKQVWGPDADQFRPERFEKGFKKGSFIPFSGGQRSCIGQHFATMEAVLAFAVLLQRYTFKVAPDYKFSLLFTGFGYRPFDLTQQRPCMRLIPVARPGRN